MPGDRVRQKADTCDEDPSHGPTLSAGAGAAHAQGGTEGAQMEADRAACAADSGRCGSRRADRGARAAGDDGEWVRMPRRAHGVRRDRYYRRGYGPPWAVGARLHVQAEPAVESHSRGEQVIPSTVSYTHLR